jgi:asparagine synthase (glutamine-hydrolysing)
MCGICGILKFERSGFFKPNLISDMTTTMKHRGPDSSGICAVGPCQFGHRRLSIIDIATGQQPMSVTVDGKRVMIVFNGEIYNYLEIRRELLDRHYIFKTKSDTEVLLNAYREWGYECVNKFRGMFCFGIWDDTLKSLFLARDRMGIKPLYYYQNRGCFIFASEIKAILASGLVESDIDPFVLDSFLSLGYAPAPKTMFKGIRKLLPGHSMSIHENGKIEVKCFWNYNKSKINNISFDDAKGKLEQLLKDSVKMRLMSEVPLGVFLSGGIDSSAIIALMYKVADQKINTFSVGYEGAEEANELCFARKVSEQFETEHHEFILEPFGFFDSIPELVRITEEPLVEMPAIPLYQIAKMAKPYATVLLSGEGSDEIFAGYGLYQKMLKMGRIGGMAKYFELIPDSCLPGDKLKKYANWLSSSISNRYRGTSCDLTERIKRSFYSPDFLEFSKQNDYLDETFLRWFRDVEGQPPLSQLLYVDSKTWLPDDLLLKADKMTMAASVELRVPFLDHKIVEFAASLPMRYKINKGIGKFILKKLMEKYLPKENIYRKKMGFTVPTKRWFAGDLLEPVNDIIFSRKLLDTGWFQKEYLEKMFDRHRKGNEDYSNRIFSLLVLYHWLDIFG